MTRAASSITVASTQFPLVRGSPVASSSASLLSGRRGSGGLHGPPGGPPRPHRAPQCASTCAPPTCVLPRSASTSRAPHPSSKPADQAASLCRRFSRLPYRIFVRAPLGTKGRSWRSGYRAARIPHRSARVFRGEGADATRVVRFWNLTSLRGLYK
jgi:hypothetical protein